MFCKSNPRLKVCDNILIFTLKKRRSVTKIILRIHYFYESEDVLINKKEGKVLRH